MDTSNEWSNEIETLLSIAKSPLQLRQRLHMNETKWWSYLSQTIPDIGLHLQSLEDHILTLFIPDLTEQPPQNDHERNLLVLHVWLNHTANELLYSFCKEYTNPYLPIT